MNYIAKGRQVVVELTNKSGGSVAEGDVVVLSSSTASSFATTSSAGQVTDWVMIVLETIADNATGKVLLSGYAPKINLSSAASLGDYMKTHTVAKQAAPTGTRGSGAFGQVLEASATPAAIIFGMPDP